MNRSIIITFLAIAMLPVYLQGNNDADSARVSLRVSGFVKSDYWIDSRTVVAAREDLFMLYPANKQYDEEGNDLSGDPVFNFSAVTSRVAAHVEGPKAFGANVHGMIEADFSGVTDADINGLRLRHAYLTLSWETLELLLGQWWHPLFSPAVIPAVVSLNTGAPFQPFIRNPQATLTYHHGRSSWIVSLIGQRDNASDGPEGVSPGYLRNTATTNAHLQWKRASGNFITGLAADYKTLRPRLAAETGIHTAETISSYAFMAYGRYVMHRWDVRTKAIYGQNLSEHLMLGGYAEKATETAGGHISYTPLNHLSLWANILHGDRLQKGVFIGYARNLGADEIMTGDFFGRGSDIAYAYRIAPSVIFTSGNVALCAELEYTAAAYGKPDSRGKVRDHREVANTRLLFTALYYF